MDRESVDEIKRHFGVVSEQLRGDLRTVAESVDSFRDDVRNRFADVGRDFEETRALIRLSYTELDRRVRTVEAEMTELRGRLERLEGRLA